MNVAINKTDKEGKTPLIRACISGNVDLVKSLLAHKDIDVNASDNQGNSALHFSSIMGHSDITQLLLEKGAHVNYLDLTGTTPLNDACIHHQKVTTQVDFFDEKGFQRGIEILLYNGADLNLANVNGWSPIHNACGHSGSTALIKTLINAGADIEQPIDNGTRPLNLACEADKPTVVKFLIENKADLNAQNKNGISATIISCYKGHPECLKLLIEAGADLNVQDKNGLTPLHLAIHNDHSKCVEMIINAGADINKADKDGDTPMHLAAIRNHPQCLKYLIDGGANESSTNNNGDTPLHIAIEKEHTICVQLLLGQKPASLTIPKAEREKAKEKETLLMRELENLLKGIDVPAGETTGSSAKSHPENAETIRGLLRRYFERGEASSTALEDFAALTEALIETDDDSTVERTEIEDDSTSTQAECFQEELADEACAPSTPDKVTATQGIEPANTDTTCQQKDIHVMDIASSFLKDLKILDVYFDPSYNVCFCEMCHTKRGDKLKYTRGNPPMDYGLPIGWCKFGLKLKPQAAAEKIFDNWHVAFHGTRVISLQKILQNGDLLKPGDVAFDGEELKIPQNHWDPENPAMKPPPGHDVKKLYFSPSIKYSGCSCYAPKFQWKDPITGQTHDIRVAFQVRIKPGAYDITAQTIGHRGEIDPLFSNNELEWSTKRFGVSMLVGLLVKIEGYTSDKIVDEAKAAIKEEPTLEQATFDATCPVRLLEECSYKTPLGGHIIKLMPGDDCLLLSKSDTECIIMHPKVDDPITLPISFIRL